MRKKLLFLLIVFFSCSTANAFDFDDLIKNTKKGFSNFTESITDLGNSIKNNITSDSNISSCQNESFTYEDTSDLTGNCLSTDTPKNQTTKNTSKTLNAKTNSNNIKYKNTKTNIPSKSNKKHSRNGSEPFPVVMEKNKGINPSQDKNSKSNLGKENSGNGLVEFFKDLSGFVSTIGDLNESVINNNSCLNKEYTYEDSSDNCQTENNLEQSNQKNTNKQNATFDTKNVSSVSGGIKIEKFTTQKNEQTKKNISPKQKPSNKIDATASLSKCNFTTFSSEEIDGMPPECFPAYRRDGAILSHLEIEPNNYKPTSKVGILDGAFGVKFGQKLNINSLKCGSLKDNFCDLTPNKPSKGWTNYSALIDPISEEIAAISAIRENKTPKSHSKIHKIIPSINANLIYKQLDSCRMTKQVFDALEFKYKKILNRQSGFEIKSYVPRINIINKKFSNYKKETASKSKQTDEYEITSTLDQNKKHCEFSTYSMEETEIQEDCNPTNNGFWDIIDDYIDDAKFDENRNFENNKNLNINQHKLKNSISQKSLHQQKNEKDTLLDNLNKYLKLMVLNNQKNVGYLKNNNYKIDVNCFIASENSNLANKVFTVVTYTDLNREGLAKNNIKNYKKIIATKAREKTIKNFAEGL